ncbi:MAG: hypothetical protein CVU05_02735 [Bacteroidetes bacterium HGW-Bacteroidetes-21]|jgi:transcriptional regulator with XRE-family HTH domain|nr:MAG: hypothetical protein CVU05_02735 [Bacteroidetes bacterium HGW-Bacteroidetes-21]
MISNKIKELIDDKRMSIKELAEKIGYTDVGFRKALFKDDFKLSTLNKIADILEIEFIDLFEDEINDYYDEYSKIENQINNLQTSIRKYAILGKALIDFSYDDDKNIVDYDFGELKEPISEAYYNKKDLLFKKKK